MSHFRCYLNRSVRLCELSSYRFTSQPTHADHPAERPRKIFSSAQFCSTSRWISLFYFCAGWQGSESCWQRLSEISNANSDFVYFWTGVEMHHACSFLFSWCRPSKWALIGRQPTEVTALREAGENLISPAPVAPDYQALSVPARPSVNVLICVFTPNLSIGVSEASR